MTEQAAPKPKTKDMRLRIVACRLVFRGRNPRGDEFTIYEVDAAREDGQLINEKLRSFDPLPIGQTVEVTVAPFNSDRHGRSFTIHEKVSARATPQRQIDELNQTVGQLREAVRVLTERVQVLEVGAPPVARPSETGGGGGSW